jgi:cytosine/uracil/thiamine/allantoin permease
MSTIADSSLSNKDLAPTGPEQRTWGTYHLAALWVGLSIVITTYTLASGLITAGMEWWQGLMTVALGTLIVLMSGYNWRALIAVAVGVIVVLPGFLHAATTEGGRAAIADPRFFDRVYDYGVFVAFALAAVTYVALSRVQTLEPAPAAAD